LRHLGLEEYAPAFAANHIDGTTLATLASDDLKELGVSSLGHRKKLLAAIAELTRAAAAEQPAAIHLEGERRPVVVLFADLCGFTPLTNTMDPEELHALIRRYAAAVDDVIVRHGGTIDKHLGDGVMALFGAPVAHGDDPARAVRAAVDAHAAVAAMAAEVGRDLRIHVGVAMGEVVAAAIDRHGHRDYTVLGDAVNLAARLESLAAPGETLISEPVRRAAGFDCDDLGERAIKGLVAPVQVWRVREPSAQGLDAERPFVGRAAELARAGEVLAAARAGRGRAILVRGEPGIGKSRVVSEVARAAAAAGFEVHRVQVLDFGLGREEDPVRALAGSLLGEAGGSDEVLAAACDAAVAAGRVPETLRPFLLDLLDLPLDTGARSVIGATTTERRLAQSRETFAHILGAAARRQPQLVIVEDVHWADPLVLGHLAALLAASAGLPVAILLSTRVIGDPIDATWRLTSGVDPDLIELAPLSRADAEALAAAAGAAGDLARACIDRAAGNPLFLDQLLRHAEDLALDAVPTSIKSLVLSRVDRLDDRDRRVLQAAAIIGQRFPLGAVAHLLRGACPVDELRRHGLVRADGDDFVFAHALIQESVYTSLLRVRRAELHRRAAEWFADRDPVLRAQHLDRAEAPEAAQAYLQAARSRSEHYDCAGALTLIERGQQVAQADVDRMALALARGEAELSIGAAAPALDTFRSAMAMPGSQDDRCSAWTGAGAALRLLDRYDEALDALEQAGAAARTSTCPDMTRIHYLRGGVYFGLGRVVECGAEHAAALELARAAGAPEDEARALSGMADAAYAAGRMRTAFANFRSCIDLARRHGFGRVESGNLFMIGITSHFLLEIDLAAEIAETALAASRRTGDLRGEMFSRLLSTYLNIDRHRLDEAERNNHEAGELAGRMRALRFEVQATEMAARIAVERGERANARRLIIDAIARAEAAPIIGYAGARMHAVLARVVDDDGERRGALAAGAEVLARGALGHNHFWYYRDAIDACLEARDHDSAEACATALERFTAVEPAPWCDLVVSRARILVRHGRGERGAPLREDLLRLRERIRAAQLRSLLGAVERAL
jgi:class 3 adenylate cyclase/tetratricopeptide (TPR) repeat protein